LKKPTTFFIAWVMAYALHAQPTSTQYLYWLRYQNQITFSPSLYWTNEADNRRFFNPDVESQLIFHSRLHLKKGKWDFGTGLTYSLVFAQKPEVGYDHSTAEIRPVIEASFEQPVGKTLFSNRIRIDNRFIQSDPDQNVFEESIFVMRFRYRVQLRIPIRTNDEGVTSISLRLADEIMLNNKYNTFDQNRIYATAEFRLDKHFSLETGYLYIYQHRLNAEEFYSRNVFRFSILHKI
jgi:Protein of unknown function (DUF2490)